MRTFNLTGDWMWILTLTWGGGPPLRLSSRPATILDGVNVYQYRGGLPALQWSDELVFGGVAVGERQVALDLMIENPADREARQGLRGRVAELAMWWPGTEFKRREIIHTGQIVDARWGEGNKLSINIREQPYEDDTLMPNPAHIVTEEDWPNADSAVIGRYFPLVLGAPGRLFERVVGFQVKAGSPALKVDSVNKLLAIAGHAVDAKQVTILDATTDTSQVFDVEYRPVKAGGKISRQVAYVSIAAGVSVVWDDTHDYYVCWNKGAGLAAYPSGSKKAITGLGDIMMYMLQRTSLRIDYPAWAALRLKMNALQVDTYTDNPNNIWGYIRDIFLSTVPNISIYSGPKGVRPVVWECWWSQYDPHVHLEHGRNAVRAGDVELAGAEIVNDLTVRWCHGDHTGRYLKKAQTTDGGNADHRLPHPAARLAPGQAKHERVIDLDWCWDHRTAWMLLQCWMDFAGLDWQRVAYDVNPSVQVLEPGDKVMLTDAKRGWDRRHCLVSASGWARNHQQVVLLMEPQR